jgi:arginyl-tRNA synthetase
MSRLTACLCILMFCVQYISCEHLFDVVANFDSLQEEEIDDAASKIGYGAVKYFDLKQNCTTNYIFNYDRMLNTSGDTAVYLLFSYARVASILRKGKEEKGFDASEQSMESLLATIAVEHPAERQLAFELLQFGDVIRSVLKDLMPNRLCDFIKETSVKFTDFVTKCHVLNSEEMHSRLILCEAARRILEKSFHLLGIETLQRI